MNAPAVLEQWHKGLLYFKLKVEEMKDWSIEKGEMKHRDRRDSSRRKGCGSQKEEEKKCLRGHVLALSPQTSIRLCHAHADVTSLMHTLCCYLHYLTVHPLSVVCSLSKQWQDFWDNFTLCNALPTFLLPFYLAELTQTFSHIWPCYLEMSSLCEFIEALSLIRPVFIE